MTRVSHQVRLCQRRGTGSPVFGPVVTKPLAQGDAVVFISSTASVSLFFCSSVAALIEWRAPAGGGDGGGGGDGSGGGEGEGDAEGESVDGGGGGGVAVSLGDGEGEFTSRPSATIPTTRAATATRPTSPIAPCLADTRDLGAVAVAGTVRGGGSAGTVSSTSPLIAQLKVCRTRGQVCGQLRRVTSELVSTEWALQCGDGCGPWLFCCGELLSFCQTRGRSIGREC